MKLEESKIKMGVKLIIWKYSIQINIYLAIIRINMYYSKTSQTILKIFYQWLYQFNKMTEEFWQQEKKKQEGNSFNTNLIWKTTHEDVKSLASDKHPKALYAECLKNSSFWHHYAASPKISVDDVAMMVCRDLGCEINYCGLIKKSYVTEWEGSSDCKDEIKGFNNCLTEERRRLTWMDQKPANMYDYIQTRLAERRAQKPFLNVLSADEQAAIKQLNERQAQAAQKEKTQTITVGGGTNETK